MVEITEKKLRELIDYTIGTCNSFSECCDSCGIEEDDLSESDLEYIFSEIFNCDICGWWSETHGNMGMDGEAVCSECFDDNEDDGEWPEE